MGATPWGELFEVRKVYSPTTNAVWVALLDELCDEFGLTWRKALKADGGVDHRQPTFIQQANAEFMAGYEAHGKEWEYIRQHFPGYPEKHRRQECVATLARHVDHAD
jgi:predicted secreted protein